MPLRCNAIRSNPCVLFVLQDAWREASQTSPPAPKIGELREDGVAKDRLERLEERIQKLHQLEGRMMTQYSSQRAREATVGTHSGSVVQEPHGFTLPNAPVHTEFLSTAATADIVGDSSGGTSTIQELFMSQPPATSQGLPIGGHDGFGRGDARAFEPRPTTLDSGLQLGPRDPATLSDLGSIEMLRNIMRDELQSIRKESGEVSSPKKSISFALDDSKESARSKADSDSTEESIIMPANRSGAEDDSDDEDKEIQPRSNPILHSETSKALHELVQAEANLKLEEKHRLHRENRSKPKSLQDAIPIACPFLFGGFSRRSPIRQACFMVQNNVYWQALFMTITATNSVYVATAPSYTDEYSIRVSWWFDLVCACIFSFEVLSGLIAYGAFMGKTTYVHNDFFHGVDLMCLFFVILEYALTTWELWPDLTLRPFRMVRIFKPITMSKSFSGIKFIIFTLREGAPQLGIIFGFLFLTIIAWDVLAMTMYGSSSRRQCVTVDTLVPACASDFSTGFNATCDFKDGLGSVVQPGGALAVSGGYPFKTWCKIVATEHEQDASGKWVEPRPDGTLVTKGYYDYSKSSRRTSWPKYNGVYHSCQASAWRNAKKRGEDFQVTQTCANVGNPQMGFSHFDNVWGSTTTMFQLIVPDSYYDVWFRSMEGDPNLILATYILFPLITVIDTFLLLGLFVAVVTGTFKRIRNEQHYSQFSGQSLEETDPNLLRPKTPPSPAKISIEDEEQIEVKDEVTQILQSARHITNHWAFDIFIQLTILWHIISLGVNDFAASDLWKTIGYWSNTCCSLIFVSECILNCMSRNSVRRFFHRHKIELVMAIISVIGLATDITIWKAIGALRGYRLMKYFKTLEALLTAARASILAILNVCIFTMLIGLCFTVTGRYLFGDAMNELTRSNFSSLFLGALTMFQLMTGDSWSSVMYASMQCMPPTDWMSQGAAAFFVLTWFVFACLIANNLFVAVILENFRIAETIEGIASDGNIAFWRNQLKLAYSNLFKKSDALLGGALTVEKQIDARHKARLAYLQKLGGKADLVDTRSLKTLEKGLVTNPESLYNRHRKNYVSPIMKALAAVALDKPFVPEEERDIPPPERVLFLLEPESLIRRGACAHCLIGLVMSFATPCCFET